MMSSFERLNNLSHKRWQATVVDGATGALDDGYCSYKGKITASN